MKGGRDTGLAIGCNGCDLGDKDGLLPVIFYRSEGAYGRIDWCYGCVKIRLGEWEPEVVILPLATGFIDHVTETLKVSRRKHPSEQLQLFAA